MSQDNPLLPVRSHHVGGRPVAAPDVIFIDAPLQRGEPLSWFIAEDPVKILEYDFMRLFSLIEVLGDGVDGLGISLQYEFLLVLQSHIEGYAHRQQNCGKWQSHRDGCGLQGPQGIGTPAKKQGAGNQAFHGCPEHALGYRCIEFAPGSNTVDHQ